MYNNTNNNNSNNNYNNNNVLFVHWTLTYMHAR